MLTAPSRANLTAIPVPDHPVLKKILFVVPPKVHLLDVNGPAHIFHEAKEYGADIELYFISISESTTLESSAGLRFSDLSPFHHFQLGVHDFIFIPGLDFQLLSDRSFLEKSRPFLMWLKQQHSNGASICSVCTGAFLLAETGLLHGKRCTTHWKYYSHFSQRFPEVELVINNLFAVNDRVYTSAGVSSGIDLALYILEEAYGARFAVDIAKEVVVYFRRSSSDPQLSIFLQYRNHLETRIHEAQDFIIRNVSAKFALEDIAQHVNMSSRNLTRLFKETIGITIGAYLEKIRIERAVHLLAEGSKMEFIAQACGLKSTNQLRVLLKKHQGVLSTEVLPEQ